MELFFVNLLKFPHKTIMEELKWTKIDPATATKEEILAEIEKMQSLRDLYMNAEQAVKSGTLINKITNSLNLDFACFLNWAVANSKDLSG